MKRPLAMAAMAAMGVAAIAAHAQKVDPRKPTTFVVGAPAGPAPVQRVDARRSGEARQPLPSGALRVAWRKTIGLAIDQPALVASDGTIAVVTARGDVVFLDLEGGEERAHVGVDGRSAGPAAMTSDGTIVFATSTGDAVGVRRTSTRPRFVSRIGGERNLRAAPLALDDGGVVLATATDLVALDSEGGVRTRVSLAETPAAPLVAAGDKVLAVTSSGAVYGWTPGREPTRMGSFGAPIDGGAALADATTLVAVIEGNHLVELDLAHGTRSTRSIAAQGLYLGPAAVRRAPASTGGRTLATVLSMTPSRVYIATLDGAGQETQRAPIATLTSQLLPDGGAPPLVAPGHTGPLVDARGAIAFASTDGKVGVVSPEGAVDMLGEAPCTRTGRNGGIAGLTPAGRGVFLITCEGGAVLAVAGPEAESIRGRGLGPAAPAPPGRPAPPSPAGTDDDD